MIEEKILLSFADKLLSLKNESSCERNKVACVILDAMNNELSYGYNEPPKNSGGCSSCCKKNEGDEKVSRDNCGSVHAEQSALITLNDYHLATKIITTCEPCWTCLKMICSTNIMSIYYIEEYLSNEIDKQKHLDYWINSGRKLDNYIRILR